MTPKELERRRKVVGASEVGLLFGLPSFGGRTVSDLWFEKKYGTSHGGKGNASTTLGTKLEPVILAEAEDRLGVKIVDRQKWVTLGCNGATLDGRVENNGALVEAKTSGILWRGDQSEWGEDGSDSVPDSYLVQVQAQLLVTGAKLAYLAALIGGRGFAMYQITPHSALMDAITTKATEFIASLGSDEPPEAPPQLETLKRIKRQPEKVVPYSDDIDQLWLELTEAKAGSKEAKETEETIQRKLLAKLGDAEAAECQGGLITYYEQSRKECVMRRLSSEYYDLQRGSNEHGCFATAFNGRQAGRLNR